MCPHQSSVTGRGFSGLPLVESKTVSSWLDNGVRLPEGQEVIALAHGTVSGARPMEGTRQHSVLDMATVGLGSVHWPLSYDDRWFTQSTNRCRLARSSVAD